MSSVLDILLAGTARDVRKDVPEREYKVLRLSREAGQDVVFRLRALPCSKCFESGERPDMDVWVTLDGVAEPDLRDTRLAAKYGLLREGQGWGAGGVTPPDLVQAMLLPGEISAISRAVQQLSGYRTATIQEVKKN